MLVKTTDRKRKDGSYPIAIEFNFNGRSILTQDDLLARIDDWEQDFERVRETKRNKDRAFVTNVVLDSLATRINNIVNEYREKNLILTNAIVINKLALKVSGDTVENFAVEHILNLVKNNQIGSAKIFAEMLYYLRKFDSHFCKKCFADIDFNYVVAFEKAQLSPKREGGPRKKGGISVNIRSLRTLLNKAIADGIGCTETYPFATKYGPRTDIYVITKRLKSKSRKPLVPKSSLLDFYNYEFDEMVYKRTKAYFFLSFFAAGINFMDLAKLKVTDIKRCFNTRGEPIEYFVYERSKTHEPIEVIINGDIREQIDILRTNFTTVSDYLLPIVTIPYEDEVALYDHIVGKRKKVSIYLKRMAKISNLPKELLNISVCYARYSFANIVYGKTNCIDIVSGVMHHTDTSTTKLYLEDVKADELAEYTKDLIR